ncbi:MAG: zinc ribbon domain-containing protein [Pseudomonadota bacterium]
MPMYDFRCPDCGHEFEELVFGARLPSLCPSCGGDGIERKVSIFAARVGGSGAAPVSSGSCRGGSPFR